MAVCCIECLPLVEGMGENRGQKDYHFGGFGMRRWEDATLLSLCPNSRHTFLPLIWTWVASGSARRAEKGLVLHLQVALELKISSPQTLV